MRRAKALCIPLQCASERERAERLECTAPTSIRPRSSPANTACAIDAAREALDYVANNLALIEAERNREAADVRARGLDRPTQP
jgi:hypothetical protein